MVSSISCKEIRLPVPDFSECDCPITLDAVCGIDGRTYLNECYATCIGVGVSDEGNCGEDWIVPGDTLTWPIQGVCIPIGTENDPKEVRALGDGTILYKNPDGTFFRGNQNLCRCLPTDSKIATPKGEKFISKLTLGELVWTFDASGNKVARPIIKMREVPVGKQHRLMYIGLSDGRNVSASPLHPIASGMPMVDLNVGDMLDGAHVVSAYFVAYTGTSTWDILPQGETGQYLVNGVKIGSTLFAGNPSGLSSLSAQ